MCNYALTHKPGAQSAAHGDGKGAVCMAKPALKSAKGKVAEVIALFSSKKKAPTKAQAAPPSAKTPRDKHRVAK